MGPKTLSSARLFLWIHSDTTPTIIRTKFYNVNINATIQRLVIIILWPQNCCTKISCSVSYCGLFLYGTPNKYHVIWFRYNHCKISLYTRLREALLTLPLLTDRRRAKRGCLKCPKSRKGWARPRKNPKNRGICPSQASHFSAKFKRLVCPRVRPSDRNEQDRFLGIFISWFCMKSL